MLRRVFKMAFWVFYDHMGKLILASVIWFLSWFLPLGLVLGVWQRIEGVWVGILGGVITVLVLFCGLPCMTASVIFMVKEFIEKNDGSLVTMFEGIRKLGGKATLVGLIFGIVGFGLLFNVWFYAARVGRSFPIVGYGLSAISLWALIFLGLIFLLVLPTLVNKGSRLREVLRLSLLLLLDNVVSVFVIGLVIVGITVLSIFVPPVLIFLYGGAVAVLLGSFYEMLARKYAALEMKLGGVGLTSGRVRFSEEEMVEVFNDVHDDYLNRGFRDFLFPWKGLTE